jgi:hypothetical protein
MFFLFISIGILLLYFSVFFWQRIRPPGGTQPASDRLPLRGQKRMRRCLLPGGLFSESAGETPRRGNPAFQPLSPAETALRNGRWALTAFSFFTRAV